MFAICLPTSIPPKKLRPNPLQTSSFHSEYLIFFVCRLNQSTPMYGLFTYIWVKKWLRGNVYNSIFLIPYRWMHLGLVFWAAKFQVL